MTWLPTEIASLQLWLDAQDTATYNGSIWTDKSSGGNNATLQTGTANLTAGAIGGQQAMRFSAARFSIPTISTVRTIVFVSGNLTGGSGTTPALAPIAGGPGAGGSDFVFIDTGNTLGYDISIDGGAGRNGNASTNGGALTAGSDIELGLNAAQNSESRLWYVDFNANANYDRIGSFTTAVQTANLNGDIGEILIFDGVLTTKDRQLLEQYLMYKWGLQANIASGHPYKLYPFRGAPADPFYVKTSLNYDVKRPDLVFGATTFSDASPQDTTTASILGNPRWTDSDNLFGFPTIKFNGPGDAINYSTSEQAFDFGTQDFTLEFWSKRTTARTDVYFGERDGSFGYFLFSTANGSLQWGARHSSGGYAVQMQSADSAIGLDTWQHIALSREGNTHYLHIDGVEVDNYINSLSFYNHPSASIRIGASDATNGNDGLIGRIGPIRVTKETSRYGAGNFTPPTDIFPQDAYGVGEDHYWNSRLIIQGAGVDGENGFFDLSPIGHVLTNQQGEQYDDTKSLFGGTSIFFDGTSDRIVLPNSNAATPTDEDFTMETWINIDNLTGNSTIYATGDTSIGNNGFLWTVNSAGGLQLFGNSADIISLSGAGTIIAGQWHHVALTRQGTTARMFIDGTLVGSGSMPINYFGNTNTVIGSRLFSGSYGDDFHGHMEGFRFLKGVALYTASFNVPFRPFGGEQNEDSDVFRSETGLLLLPDGEVDAGNNFIDRSVNEATITAVANAQVDSDLQRVPGGSILLDGTGDYLSVPDDPSLRLGGENFTIEFDVWFAGFNAANTIMGKWSDNVVDQREFMIRYRQSLTDWQFFYSTDGNGDIELAFDFNSSSLRWYHIAFVRNDGVLTCYVDGTSIGTQALTATLHGDVSPLFIGMQNAGTDVAPSVANEHNGNIANIRFTKGVARYTQNFDVPYRALAYPVAEVVPPPVVVDGEDGFWDLVKNNIPLRGDLNDSGSTGSTVTLVGSTVDSDGLVTAVGDYATIPNSEFNWIEPWTVDVTCKLDSFNGANVAMIISNRKGVAQDGGFQITQRQDGSVGLNVYRNNNYQETLSATSTVGTATEHTYRATHDGNATYSFWVDGNYIGQHTVPDGIVGSGDDFNTTFYFGRQANGPSSADRAVIGKIRDFRFTQSVRTEAGSNYALETRPYGTGRDDRVDPFLGNTEMIAKFEGANGATTFLDQSKNMIDSATFVGNAAIDDTRFKFGASSLGLDGLGDWVELAGDAMATIGDLDFTIEMWAWFDVNDDEVLLDTRPNSTDGFYPYIFASSGNLNYHANAGVRITSGNTIPTGQWIHIAVSRIAGTTRLFMNGVSEGSFSDSFTYVAWPAMRPILGTRGTNQSGGFHDGNIDELRITVGTGRYFTDFTVPQRSFATPNLVVVDTLKRRLQLIF